MSRIESTQFRTATKKTTTRIYDSGIAEQAKMRIRFSGNEIEILTPAKVNLFLELLGRRQDGFHQLETIISSISLFDTLRFRPRKDDQIRLQVFGQAPRSHGPHIPTDENNLIVRSLRLVRDTHVAHGAQPALDNYGVDVACLKRIPIQAGLGGASANAAGAIIAGNRLWNCNFGLEQMREIGAQIGSDVPFFLFGGTGICRGRGERVERLSGPSGRWLVVAKPPIGLSTAKVFQNCPDASQYQHQSPQALLDFLALGDIRSIGRQLFNRLQVCAASMTDWIDRLRHSFSCVNCLGHQMTGSGSSYFGVFSNRIAAIRAASCLSNRHPNAKIFTCQTLNPCRWNSIQTVAVD